jgi:hypothetical protein
LSIVDRFPADSPTSRAPRVWTACRPSRRSSGRELSWAASRSPGTQVRTVKLLLAVGAGVGEGEYVEPRAGA